METITCIVHTRNSQATLAAALQSVTWVDELLVVDMASRDETLAIAEQFATRVLTAVPAPRIDGIRNRFVAQAAGQWVLVLDSDERLPADGEASVRRLIAEQGRHYDAFAIPRFNSIAGQVMRGSGWYPDQQVRLFRQGTVRWRDSNHQSPEIVSGGHRLLALQPPGCLHIHHENYADLTQFIRRQLDYAISESYDPDPDRFDCDDYLALAHQRLAERGDVQQDGDLARALALVLAWDAVIRGLIHWDRLQPRPALVDAAALPQTPRLEVARRPRRPPGRLDQLVVRAWWLLRHEGVANLAHRVVLKLRQMARLFQQ